MVNVVNGLQVFSNPQFGEIRTLVIEDTPWAVGKDVARTLGYKDTVNAIKAHVDPEDKRGWQITTPSGEQKMTIINESGIYSLIFSSKLPAAKAFKRWVTSEVLPTIRRTGGYNAQGAAGDAGTTLRLMEELMAAREEVAALKLQKARKETADLRRKLEAATVPPDVLEEKRRKDRERQRRYRERQKQGALAALEAATK